MKLKGYLNVVEATHHQLLNAQPEGETRRFRIALTTEEQPYKRRVVIGEDWIALDTGWIKACSMLEIANEQGVNPTHNPSELERAATESAIIEIGVAGAALLVATEVRPGTNVRLQPPDLAALVIRCKKGKAVVFITAYPT